MGYKIRQTTKPLINSVSTQTNGINTPTAYTKGIMVNVILGTLGQSNLPKYQTTMFSVLGSLVNHLAMREKNLGFKTQEGHYFLKSQGFSKTKDPDIFYWKTSKVCLVTNREKLSKKYLGFLPAWGIDVNGGFLIAANSVFPKIENGFTLSELIKGAERTPLRFLKRNQKNIHGDYAFTIDVGDTGGVMVNGRKRKLTINEKEVLQGFPKDWTKGEPERERHKMLGNAVTTNVITEIIKRLAFAL